MGDLSDYFAFIKSVSRKTCHGLTSQTQNQGEDNCTHYHTKWGVWVKTTTIAKNIRKTVNIYYIDFIIHQSMPFTANETMSYNSNDNSI